MSVASWRMTNLTVGHKMVPGIMREEKIYGDGLSRSLGMSLQGGLTFESNTNVFKLDGAGGPRPAKDLIFEYRITIFETDLPAQHMWAPTSGRHYKVLWTHTWNERVP